MSRNASGTYALPVGNPVVTGTTISASWANTTLSDLATEMTDSLDRSGKGGMLAALGLVDGTVGAPGLMFNSETTSGLYRAGANDVRLAVGGVDKLRLTAASGTPALTATSPQAAAGTATDFLFATTAIRTAGLLLDVQNSGTSKANLDTTGKLTLAAGLVATTGAFSGAVTGASYDAASAAGLTVGGTNATSVTLGKAGVGVTVAATLGVTGASTLAGLSATTGSFSGAVTGSSFDAASAAGLTVGGSNATSVTLGKAGVGVSIPATLSVTGSASAASLSLSGALSGATTGGFSSTVTAAALSLSGAITGATTGGFSSTVTAGALSSPSLDNGGALSLGASSATSLTLGRSGVNVTVPTALAMTASLPASNAGSTGGILTSGNGIRAWALLTLGAAGAVTVTAGFNISSASWATSTLTVNLANAMPDTNRGAIANYQGGYIVTNVAYLGAQFTNASTITINQVSTSGSGLVTWASGTPVYLIVFG